MGKGLVIGDIVITLANNQDNYNRYLNDISKFNLLTLEEEFEYFTKYRSGDISYYDKIAERNLRFVISVAKKFQNIVQHGTALTLEDLISEGNLGLCIAIQKFDPSHGFKFITYAVWQIRSKIMECIYQNLRTIRQPSNRQQLINKINKLEMELQQQYNMEEIPVEILQDYLTSKDVKLSDTITNLRKDMLYTASLDLQVPQMQIKCNSVVNLYDIIEDQSFEGPVETLLGLEKKQYINKLLTQIPKKVAEYFEHFYGLNNQPALKISEIAELLNISNTTISKKLQLWTRRLNRIYEQEYNQIYA